MNRTKYSIILVLILVVFLSGCTLGNETEEAVELRPIPVVIEKVELKSIDQGERFIGKIKANQNIFVSPKITAKIEEIYVEQGDTVIKQQILMKLDDTYVKDSLRQAEAVYQSSLSNLNQAKERQSSSIIQTEAQLEIAEDSYEQAKKNLDDVTELHDEGRANDNQLDQAESAYLQAENNLKIARDSYEKAQSSTNIDAIKASLDQAEIGLEQAQRAVEDTKVYASISGQVASVRVEEGDMASPQIPAVQIVNQDIVYVNLNVTENSLNNFEEGEIIDIYIPSLDKNVEGKVTFISPVASEQTLTFLIEIKINNEDNQLKSGMLVETILTFSDDEEYIVIPTQAVLGTGKDTYVYVVNDGKAYKKSIEVKDMTTEETIIIYGLSVDDEVVIKGQYNLDNGSDVEIIQEEGEAS